MNEMKRKASDRSAGRVGHPPVPVSIARGPGLPVVPAIGRNLAGAAAAPGGHRLGSHHPLAGSVADLGIASAAVIHAWPSPRRHGRVAFRELLPGLGARLLPPLHLGLHGVAAGPGQRHHRQRRAPGNDQPHPAAGPRTPRGLGGDGGAWGSPSFSTTMPTRRSWDLRSGRCSIGSSCPGPSWPTSSTRPRLPSPVSRWSRPGSGPRSPICRARPGTWDWTPVDTGSSSRRWDTGSTASSPCSW